MVAVMLVQFSASHQHGVVVTLNHKDKGVRLDTVKVLACIKLMVIIWLSLLLIGGDGSGQSQQTFLAAAMVTVAEIMTFIPVAILLVTDEEEAIYLMVAAPQPAS